MLSAEGVQPLIRAVAAGHYFAVRHCLSDGAAGFLQVRAVVEAALADIRGEFDEVELKLLLRYYLHHFDIEGRKARRVCGICTAADVKKLDMARGVLSAAKLLADLRGLYVQSRRQGVHYAGLANAGIARERADLPGYLAAQGVYSGAVRHARAHDGEARRGKYPLQLISRIDVGLVDADNNREI